jgi:hypothetical protein
MRPRSEPWAAAGFDLFEEASMPRYLFTLDAPELPGTMEEFPDDKAAKLQACVIADEINRNAQSRSRVFVLDEDGELVAAVSPMDE